MSFRTCMRRSCACLNRYSLVAAFAANAYALTFSEWQTASFTSAELDDAATCGPAADPDADGLPNLHEYHFGSDPRQPDSPDVRPLLESADGSYTLRHRQALGAEDSLAWLQASPDLIHWVTYGSEAEVSHEEFPAATEIVLADFMETEPERRFLRLRIDLAPFDFSLRAPSGLSLILHEPTQWELLWNDLNLAETAYEIQRLSPRTGLWTTLATVSSNQIAWLDAAADPGEGLSYRVLAHDQYGNTRASDPIAAPDSDGDGLPDALELASAYTGEPGTYASSPDQAVDPLSGISDGWAALYDYLGTPGGGDADDDGVTDLVEAQNHINPFAADTDLDGRSDAWELEHGYDPLHRHSPYLLAPAGLKPMAFAPGSLRIQLLNQNGWVWENNAYTRFPHFAAEHAPALEIYNELLFGTDSDYTGTYRVMGGTGLMVTESRDYFLLGDLLQSHTQLLVWPGDGQPAFRIKGTPWYDDSYLVEGFPAQWNSYVRLLAIDLLGRLWCTVNTSAASHQLRLYNPDGSYTVKFSAATESPWFVSVLQSNGTKTIGYFEDLQNNRVGPFVGQPTLEDAVDYLPFALNRRGDVLGDDRLDAFYYYEETALDNRVLEAERTATAILQSHHGTYVEHAFVVGEDGVRHYLPLNAAEITGFDDEANVYGRELDGRSVVWMAEPEAWGHPPETPRYAPAPYVPPVLPTGLLALTNIRPDSRLRPELVQIGREDIANNGTGQGALLLPAGLAVDYNRDGVIESVKDTEIDATSSRRPFRFWSNDDDDDGDDKRAAADDIPLPEGDSKRDSENTKVDGIRDLEDFFPVYFDIKQLLSVLPPGTNDLAYYLKHDDSALGVVFTSYTRAQAFDYLRGSPTALDTGFGPALTQKAGDATVVKITAAGVNISTTGQPTASPAFFDRIKNNDGGVLLIETSKATTKPLVLEVRKGSVVIAEISLHLKVDPVETMFRYVNLRSLANGTPIASDNQGPGYGSTTPPAAPNDPFATATNRKNMVFVHGYNVNGEGARGAAATAFKRFYWSGSKAKFYAVLWRGDDGQGAGIAPAGATPDYHRNVGHAWQQGPLFRDFLGTLQGDTAIMAHSLGNGVTKVALTRARDPNNPARLVPASKPATVKHYFAVDSALPLEATSASDITTESKSRMRHSWWAEYDSQERLWPTHWHELFAGTGDGREGLTWQNVFANLEVGTNFYSSGEEVLANPVNDSMPVWEPLFFAGLRAWVAQEKHKGGNGVAASFFRSWTAGWVENKAWYVPIVPTPPFGSPQTRRRFASEAQDVAAPNGVPSSALASEPFFQRFQASESGGFYPGYQGSRLHAPIGDTNADDEARKLVTVAKCLGEAIPALSYPQGSNPASAFTLPGMGGNFNLNDDYDPNTGLGFKNSWPTSRPRNDWLHSNCLDVSYIFHFRFYDHMKINGGL